MADIVDRRRWFAATQLWVALVATFLALLALMDGLTPNLLLLTFANGVGLAEPCPVSDVAYLADPPRHLGTQANKCGPKLGEYDGRSGVLDATHCGCPRTSASAVRSSDDA